MEDKTKTGNKSTNHVASGTNIDLDLLKVADDHNLRKIIYDALPDRCDRLTELQICSKMNDYLWQAGVEFLYQPGLLLPLQYEIRNKDWSNFFFINGQYYRSIHSDFLFTPNTALEIKIKEYLSSDDKKQLIEYSHCLGIDSVLLLWIKGKDTLFYKLGNGTFRWRLD